MRYDPATGLWIDDSTGLYYDDQGNPADPTAAGGSTVTGPSAPFPGPGGASAGTAPGSNYGGSSGAATTKIPISHIDLGDRVTTFYSDGTSDTQAKGRLPTAVNPNASVVHTTERLIDPNQIAVEQSRAKNALDIANANNARQTQQDLGFFGGVPTLQAQIAAGRMVGGQQTEQGREFDSGKALDYYKYLSDLASNPRNFVQSYFAQRGGVAPAAANGQGNVDAIQRYLPFLLGGAQSTPTSGAASSAAPSGGARGGTQTEGPMTPPLTTKPWALGTPANTSPNPAPITASAPMQQRFSDGRVTTDMPGGAPGQVFRGVGNQGPEFGVAFNEHADAPITGTPGAPNQPANIAGGYGKIGPRDASYLPTTGYARGGVLTETVVGKGTATGRPYVFNEDPARPEGVVPADVLPRFLQQRHGQMGAFARGGIIGEDIAQPGGGDPYNVPDAYTAPNAAIDPGLGSNFSATGPQSGFTALPYAAPLQAPDPYAVPTTRPVSDVAPTGALPDQGALTRPSPTPATTTPAPSATAPVGSPFESPDAQPVSTPVGAVTPGVASPVGSVSPGVQTPTASSPNPQDFLPSFVQQPIGQPQASNNFNASSAPQTGVTPADVSPPGTFGGAAGGMPQFLPGEDQMNPILAALQSHGAVPPFLQRVLGQQKGIDALGTNQPQRLDLPKGLPVLSNLAYEQMTPSEQQGLLSYASALGVTPEDYLAFIRMFSPHGAPAKAPLFGNRFAAAPQ